MKTAKKSQSCVELSPLLLFSVHLLCVKLTRNQDAATIKHKVKQAEFWILHEDITERSAADAPACFSFIRLFPLMFREVKFEKHGGVFFSWQICRVWGFEWRQLGFSLSSNRPVRDCFDWWWSEGRMYSAFMFWWGLKERHIAQFAVGAIVVYFTFPN